MMKDSFDGAKEVNRRRLIIHTAKNCAGQNFKARKLFLHYPKKSDVTAKGKSARIASALQVLFDAINVMLSMFLRLKLLVQSRD
jgi:hypothetical protein